MEWADFISWRLCGWVKEQVGKGASFGSDVLFNYDRRWPGEVPVFHNRTFIFTDSNHEIRLKIDDLDTSREIFLRLRDLHHLSVPIGVRSESCFGLDIRPHADLLDCVEYLRGDLLMRARLKQAVYRDINKHGESVFNVLNDVSFRSILGAMYSFGPVS